MLENLVTCPICAGKLPQATFAGLCPKCVLEESFQRLEATEWLLARREIHPPESYGSRPGMAIGDYELLEEIARGGMGIVYKARQVSLDRIVAVKLLLFGSYSSPEFVRRFGIEAAAAASLQHPNIVAIHEVGFRDGQHFLAMDYIAGKSLAEIVRKGPLPSRQAATYVKTTAEAIHYAHEHGLLHRDLKPSNVLIDGFDQPKITDFGLAKRLDPDSQLALEESQLTLTGQVLGSPSYMPPEQAAAKRGEASRGSDVYSLGAILYHLVTGQPPFHTGSVAETLQQVLHHEPAPPRSRCAGVPRALETICLKCLEKDPARRYSTAQEMADELGRFLRDEPILARPAGPVEKAWRWTRRNPALAAVVLILCLTLALLIWQREQRSQVTTAARSQRDQDQGRIYAGDMKLAHAAYKDGNTARALELLHRHQPQPHDPPGFEWRWLYRLCLAQSEIIDKHSTFCGSAAFSPDGRTLAFGTGDGFIRLFDLRHRQLSKSWKAHDEFIRTIAFHPLHINWLATVSGHDGLLKVWDVATQRLLLMTNAAAKGLWANVAFSPNGDFVSAGAPDGRSLNLWEFRGATASGVASLILRTNLPFSGPAVFAPDGRTLAVCNGRLSRRPANYSFDAELALFDLSSGTLTPFPKAHRDFLMCVAFSPDSKTIATGGADDFVILRDAHDPARSRRFEASGITNVTALVFTPAGDTLFAGGLDRAIRFWRLDPAADPKTFFLHGHSKDVHTLALSGDGKWLASTGQEGAARLWSLPAEQNDSKTPLSGEFTTILGPEPTSDVQRIRYWTLVVVGPDQQTVAVLAQNKLTLCDLATGAELASNPATNIFEVGPSALRSVAFSPDGRQIATGGMNGMIAFLDAATLRPTKPSVAVHESRVTDLAFCLNGAVLATGGGKEVKLTEMASGRLLKTIRAVEAVDPEIREGIDTLQVLAVSPDGKLLATGSPEQLVRLWDIASGKLIASTPGMIELLYAFEFSPDGKTLAIANGNSIILWDFKDRRPMRTLPGHASRVTALAFSPDGRRLVSASTDRALKLWSPDVDQEVAVLEGHDVMARGVAFALRGDALVCGSKDGSLKLWRALPLERLPSQRASFNR